MIAEMTNNVKGHNPRFEKLLKKNELKLTKPRLRVLEIIANKKTAISQPDLEKLIGDQVDRVTLYRILGVFEEKGILHKIFDLNGTATYALCSTKCDADHHDDEHVHFICSSCNNIHCLDEVALPAIPIPAGYTRASVGIQVVGLCEECNMNPSPKDI